jgi:hypothetical protein
MITNLTTIEVHKIVNLDIFTEFDIRCDRLEFHVNSLKVKRLRSDDRYALRAVGFTSQRLEGGGKYNTVGGGEDHSI